MAEIEKLRFLTPEQAHQIAEKFGTPTYVYDEATLIRQAKAALAFPSPFGLTVRYAMKANPHTQILQIFNKHGIKIDASSGYEAERALRAGFSGEDILLTTQELPNNLEALVNKDVLFDAASLSQLETYGTLFPNSNISIRLNPGFGSGFNNRNSTAGPNASFGIWHEHLTEVKRLADRFKLKIVCVLNHVGSGRDPELWQHVAAIGLDSIRQLPDVRTFSMGGGFKIAYMHEDLGSNLKKIGTAITEEIEKFSRADGRKLRLEIEPGRFLVAEAASLLCRVQDKADTGEAGHEFLKLDAGMSEIIRPAMYGAQHPIVVINKSNEHQKYVVAGHCCETSDTFTTELDDPEAIDPRLLKTAAIGDLTAIENTGAYCISMSTINYNSFPRAAEVMLSTTGETELISRRQTLEEMLALEERIEENA